MNDAELEACGIAPDMVRLSCGIGVHGGLSPTSKQALASL